MNYEYDVALSFAGEDRKFVEDCAEILRALNINVFYDNYEKEVLLGKNLYSYLADVYQNKARFAIVFVSESYGSRSEISLPSVSIEALPVFILISIVSISFDESN